VDSATSLKWGHVTVDQWADFGIVCGALVAAVTLAALAWRGIRRMWHLLRKVNRLLDQTLGEPANGNHPARPSLMERVESIESKLEAHLEWHANPAGRPASGFPLQPNGPRRGRRPE
jgi:hypothetical protein